MMTYDEGDTTVRKIVSALDIAHALASELSFGTGLLPNNTLWWSNTRAGPVFALYQASKVWKAALQEDPNKPARRYSLPMPGLIFLCSPGHPPYVYAVKKKPTKELDIVYEAPLANIFENGRSCPGSHKYPDRIQDMVKSFFMAFFSRAGDLRGRSKKFPDDVLKLWDFLDGGKTFPMDDLVKICTIRDLLNMVVR